MLQMHAQRKIVQEKSSKKNEVSMPYGQSVTKLTTFYGNLTNG